jgi:hypothetical protein
LAAGAHAEPINACAPALLDRDRDCFLDRMRFVTFLLGFMNALKGEKLYYILT